MTKNKIARKEEIKIYARSEIKTDFVIRFQNIKIILGILYFNKLEKIIFFPP